MNSSVQNLNLNSILYKKYLFTKDDYDKNIITNILYNEKTHIVSIFKELLIYDDPGEFLNRFYYLNECLYKIKSYCEIYQKNRKNFPNFVILPESKYIFKNIKKKQKLLDQEISKEKSNEENNSSFKKIFSNSVMNSIFSNDSNSNSSDNKSIKKLLKNIIENEEKDNFSDKSNQSKIRKL